MGSPEMKPRVSQAVPLTASGTPYAPYESSPALGAILWYGRKLTAFRSGGQLAATAGDYAVYVTANSIAGQHFGKLEVIRKPDGKMIYPYDGASSIGPYATVDQARREASEYGWLLVEADLKNPE